ncbi:DUF221-domain-containing protein [Patellaria atrata CBS 101060]|uniref:DUF221-domain-containing protein n=1 Tax=Patellaria atrata CBS 101060 TaxID=1346257 RepID=A0A9P4SJL3_9PEZI|nr:DUF221-domain-containing protein [Patellaria atrata CBS 101060]
MASQQFLDATGESFSNLNGWNTWTTKDPTSGGHRRGSTSFSAIIAAFIPTFLTAVVYLTIFIFIRGRYRSFYAPRTYFPTIPEKDHTPLQGHGKLDWAHSVRHLNDKFILRHNSLDAYLFLRFLRNLILICFIGCCLTWPILFPINAMGGGTATQLDRISFSNVYDKKKLYAHAVIAWVFIIIVLFLVTRERIYLVGLRQAYLSSKTQAARLSSRTILFLNPPEGANDESNLKRIFGDEAQRSWVVSDVCEISKVADERNSKAMQLEGAEVKMIIDANKKRLKANKEGNASNGNRDEEDLIRNSRPSHRLQAGVGEEVDTIEWSRKKTSELAEKVQKARESYNAEDSHGARAIFVEYTDQIAARQAYRELNLQHQVNQVENTLQKDLRFIGMVPKEILWDNIIMTPAARISGNYSSWALVIAIIIFWSIPVGVVGTLSNISELTNRVRFLRFLDNLPPSIMGLIRGFLPPFLLSLLVSYVPKFFRYIAKKTEPSNSQAELKTQNWYFIFQVIQVFLVTTFTSGATSVVTKIAKEPSSIPILLGNNLPKASNFYLTYFILQGVASSADNILNYSDLIEDIFLGRLFDKTPRDKYTRYTYMKGLSWGSSYPKFTNFAVIAIAYSCIAPLVLGFAGIGISLYYLSYRYNLLFTMQSKIDTKGQAYSRALQHMLTGVYLSELCLLGLFSIRTAPGPLIMMLILFFLTIFYHYLMNRHIKPMEKYLPLHPDEDEQEPLLSAAEEGHSGSRIESLGHGRLPRRILDPVARFLEPHIFASRQAMAEWLREATPHDPSPTEEEPPSYSDEEVKNAYLHPALTSKTPKLWLVRDQMGLSRREIEENGKVGIGSSDEGAELDGKGNVVWSEDDFEKVPVFKRPVVY